MFCFFLDGPSILAKGSSSSLFFWCFSSFWFPTVAFTVALKNQHKIVVQNKKHSVVLTDSVGQEFGQDIAEMACVFSAS